ncbi:MAG TPA: DUF1659 domain-containing protein [Bacillota bacterium]|nr:DUF1659 domain-containing protein [Bacillota bacterium]
MLTTNDTKQVKIVFISGTNAQGNPIRKSRIYKKVNAANASLDHVYAFGQAVAALSDWTLDQVILSVDQEILNVN